MNHLYAVASARASPYSAAQEKRFHDEHYATFCLSLGCVLTSSGIRAQVAPPTILEIDIDNIAFYGRDSGDISKYATEPNRTVTTQCCNFGFSEGIGDVVAVNGTPVKGTFTAQASGVLYSPNPSESPTLRFGIADTFATGRLIYEVDIWNLDGTQIGTLFAMGLNNTPRPPGAPLVSESLNLVVLGGTGAFLGVRGQMQSSKLIRPPNRPNPSMLEDPRFRRDFAEGRGFSFRRIAHLVPFQVPAISTILHGADFSPVTSANPARAGELLVVRASGLGPTRPGVDPGQPFPANKVQEVNSPVELLVNGRTAEVVNKIGWPGLVDTYRVDFRMPGGSPAGTATVQLSAAWIMGVPAQIPVQ